MVTLGGKEFALAPRYASFDGYNVHANVFLAAHDRSGLERLCRYILRPALAVGRIERLPDGRVRSTSRGGRGDVEAVRAARPAQIFRTAPLAALVVSAA